MSKTKHTSGPWKANRTETGSYAIKGEDYNKTRWARIATVDNECVKSEEMLEANARLIAAAPELFECLRELLDRRSKSFIPDEDGWTTRAEAAIAKVEEISDRRKF